MKNNNPIQKNLPARLINKLYREQKNFFRRARCAIKQRLKIRLNIHFALRWRLGNETLSIPVYEAAKRAFPACRLSVSVNYPEILYGNTCVDIINPRKDDFDIVYDIRSIDPLRGVYNYLEGIVNFKIENRTPKIYATNVVNDKEIDEWLLLNKGRVIIALSSEASWNCKCWPLDNYRRLRGSIVRDYNAAIVDVGLDENKTTGGYDLKNKTDIGRLIYLLSKIDVYIGNDTAHLHLALALGKRAIGIFGPVLPSTLIEENDNFTYVNKDIPCAGCWSRGIMDTPGRCPMEKVYCMEELRFEDVYKAVTKVLGNN